MNQYNVMKHLKVIHILHLYLQDGLPAHVGPVQPGRSGWERLGGSADRNQHTRAGRPKPRANVQQQKVRVCVFKMSNCHGVFDAFTD